MCTRRVWVFLLAAMSGLCADQRFMIVLIGPTGAGKTTQSEFLHRRFGLPVLSADELIAKNPDAIAKYQETGIDPGTPQATPALNQLVAAELIKMDLTKGVVLDGYPATKDQADHLETLVKQLKLPRPVIFHIQIPDEVARERARKRGRVDDTPEKIEQRLKNYHRELEFVKSYYPRANIWEIDGTKSPVEVSRTIQAILTDELPKRK